MLTRGGNVVACRKLLDQLDVGDQSRARESSFEKIVAQERVVGNAARERGFEHLDIVNPLAAVRAFIEKILVNVGNREGVRIDSRAARKNALENRAVASGRQRCGDARLKNCVTFDDAAELMVEARSIQRMRHLADHPLGRAARQARVGVERDHVAHAGGYRGRVTIRSDEADIRRAAQQPIQFVQLSALALPSHPHAFSRVPDALAMEQQKSRAGRPRLVTLIQTRHSRLRSRQQIVVAGRRFVYRIDPIRQQREVQLAVRTRQIVHLEALDLLVDLGVRGQQRRHDDQRAQVRRYSIAQRQRGNRRGVDDACDRAIDQCDCRVHRGNYREHRKHAASPFANARVRDCQQAERDDYRGDDRDRTEVSLDSGFLVGASDPVADRRTKSQLRFERGTSL